MPVEEQDHLREIGKWDIHRLRIDEIMEAPLPIVIASKSKKIGVIMSWKRFLLMQAALEWAQEQGILVGKAET